MGSVLIMYDKVVPASTSVPAKVMVASVSSVPVIVCAVATGASFTAVTVIETVALSDNAPSLAEKTNESLPL